MRSIPISVMILNDLADAIIDEDLRKEKASRKRALRLAISQSWTTAFNNQVSHAIHWQRFEAIRARILTLPTLFSCSLVLQRLEKV